MSANKQILVGLVMVSLAFSIGFTGSAQAWDEESGYAESEYVNIEFTDGSSYMNHKNNEAPAWISKPLMMIIKIVRFFIGGDSSNEIAVAVETTALTWNNTADAYEEDGTNWAYETNLILNANVTNTDNIELDPVDEYFKNNTEKIEDFKTIDDDPEHPDILNVSVTIEGGGVDIEDYGYSAITNEGMDGINERINNPDYGFDLDGRGSDGGSGSIYEGIDMYGGAGDESGMGAGFGWIFFGLIPVIFLFAVFKFCRRVLWGED